MRRSRWCRSQNSQSTAAPSMASEFAVNAVPDSLETHAPDATPRDPECQSIVAATRAIESDDPGAMES